jgi:ABC-type polysaccharide/polyol phosphate export permease
LVDGPTRTATREARGAPERLRVTPFVLRRVASTIRHRYAESGLGIVWNVAAPLMTILLFSLAFGVLLDRGRAGIDIPFPIWLCVGLLPFEAFREAVAKGLVSLRRNAGYLKKLPVPEHAFVLESALVALANGVISMGVLACVVGVWELTKGAGSPRVLSAWWALGVVPLVCLLVTGLGIGLLLGTLRVFLADQEQASQPIQRVLFWTSPAIIPLFVFGDAGIGVVPLVNPAGPALMSMRSLLIDHEFPSTLVMVLVPVHACVWVALGTLVYTKLRREIRDQL